MQIAVVPDAKATLAEQTALYEELGHFFRDLGRVDLAKAVDAQRRMIDLAVQRIETRIDKLDLETTIGTTLDDSSTSWPASAASTPDR